MKLIPKTNFYKKNIHCDETLLLNKHRYTIACSGDSFPGENEEAGKNMDEPGLPNTTCAFCKNDFEGTTLDKLSVYPICRSCKSNLDKKIFPAWVKLFFAGVILLVIFSMFWNWRFYSAYMEIKNAGKASAGNNITKAALLMKNAADHVPESKEVSSLASYYKAIDLLRKDKSTEALTELNNCSDLSADFNVNGLVLQAEMGSGFDTKDYNLFLKSSKAFLQLDTTKAGSWAGVSSAYACLYAQNNADSLKQLSLKYYNRAKALDDTSADEKEYYGLIQYRLDTRQIITRKQFDQKYPNGYTSNSSK
jgi:hypothetical protein